MVIEKYWGNYIGGTDDSLTLLDYLAGKQKDEIPLREIFADTGLDKLNWNFRNTEFRSNIKIKRVGNMSLILRSILLPIWPHFC